MLSYQPVSPNTDLHSCSFMSTLACLLMVMPCAKQLLGLQCKNRWKADPRLASNPANLSARAADRVAQHDC